MDLRTGGKPAKIDPDRLSPTARALAEAIMEAGDTADIRLDSDHPIRDTDHDRHQRYTPAEAARPERRAWRGWADTEPRRGGAPHARLEWEASKIPVGWHVLGYRPDRPLPNAGPVREVSSGP